MEKSTKIALGLGAGSISLFALAMYLWIPELPFGFNYWNKENIGQ